MHCVQQPNILAKVQQQPQAQELGVLYDGFHMEKNLYSYKQAAENHLQFKAMGSAVKTVCHH